MLITVNCVGCAKELTRQRERNDATCEQCGLRKIRENYYKNREKRIAQVRKYREENKAKIAEERKIAYQLNKAVTLKRVKEYYVKNRLSILKKSVDYRKLNAEAILVKNRNRKNLLRSLGKTSDITNGYLREILDKTKKCPLCKKQLTNRTEKHIDHIVPIGVGGLHMKANIRVICRTCNLTRPKNGN